MSLSRRDFLQLSGAAVAAHAIAAPGALAAETPQRGGVFRIRGEDATTGFDPHLDEPLLYAQPPRQGQGGPLGDAGNPAPRARPGGIVVAAQRSDLCLQAPERCALAPEAAGEWPRADGRRC